MKKGKKLCCGLLAVMMLTMSIPAVAQAQDDISIYEEVDPKAAVKKWASARKYYSSEDEIPTKIYISEKIDGVNCTGYIPRTNYFFDAGHNLWIADFGGYVYGNQ